MIETPGESAALPDTTRNKVFPAMHRNSTPARRKIPAALLAAACLLLTACGSQPTEHQVSYSGTLKSGESFEGSFGGQFIFSLKPSDHGWRIAVHEEARWDDLSRLTPPLHTTLNPREIEGWQFRNEDNTAPNTGSVNAPQEERHFIFSPEVGRVLQGPTSVASVTPQEIERIAAFGKGVLHITRLVLSPVMRGERAKILEMDFDCTIIWSREILNRNIPPALDAIYRPDPIPDMKGVLPQ